MEESVRDVPTVGQNLNKKKSKISNPFSGVARPRCPGAEYRVTGTQFSTSEIKERAELFKHEYNREDLHDRVLVLQVMPDDYEMRELTARLALNECARTDEMESKQELCRESSSEKSTSGFCADIMHTKEEVLEESTCLDVPAEDSRRPSSTYGFRRSEPDEVETTLEKFGSESEATIQRSAEYLEKSDIETETFSYWNESKTERSDIVCSGGASSNDEDIAREKGEAKATDSEAIDYSTCSSKICSDPERRIPRTRNFFHEVNTETGFPQNEEKLKGYPEHRDDAIDTGSMRFEPAVAYSDKTGFECVGAEYGKGTECGLISECDQGTSQCDQGTFECDQGTFECDQGTSPRKTLGTRLGTSAGACDVHVLREHRIYVHACWLAVNSLYFRSLLFESGMRECSTVEFSMKVSESEENGFLSLLKSIYDPDVLSNLDITPLMNVLRLSVKYDVRFSTLKAKRVLERMPLTLEVCETIIEAVGTGGLPDLGEVMKNVELFLLSEFEPLDETWESEKFATLSEHALRFLFGSDRLVVQSENTVFIALMQWIARNAELYEDITAYSDLLSLVRFKIMKPTYIHDVVRQHEIATQLENFDAVYLKAITYHAMPRKRREVCAKGRQWCEPKTPTFMWILYPEPEMFAFDEEASSSSTESSSFWYFGYKMHLRLDLSTSQDETVLVLVVENLADDGSVELVYNVDVKFGEGLHRSFTCERFVYCGNDRSPPPGNYPFEDRFSVGEIREIVLGGSSKVAITFEITVEKILTD